MKRIFDHKPYEISIYKFGFRETFIKIFERIPKSSIRNNYKTSVYYDNLFYNFPRLQRMQITRIISNARAQKPTRTVSADPIFTTIA